VGVEKWFDDDAGPMVRPYTVTGGRTRPARPDLNMITMVTALSSAEHPAMAPEHQAILDACQSPQSVAEVAAVLGLPLGVIKILLGDLVEQGLVTYRQPYRGIPDRVLLRSLREAVTRL
jgi:Protein of unknown function (DUF742)